MNDVYEPDKGGLSLTEAYDQHLDAETLEAIRIAEERPGANARGVIRGSAEYRNKELLRQARGAARSEFGNLFLSETLIAYGNDGGPLGRRIQIPAPAWRYAALSFVDDTVTVPENRIIYSVRVYPREIVDELRDRRGSQSPHGIGHNSGAIEGGSDVAPQRKDKLYDLVCTIWENWPEDVKALATVHGGKAELKKRFVEALPDHNPSSVERMATQLFSDLGLTRRRNSPARKD